MKFRIKLKSKTHPAKNKAIRRPSLKFVRALANMKEAKAYDAKIEAELKAKNKKKK